jgi:hypothetical protein
MSAVRISSSRTARGDADLGSRSGGAVSSTPGTIPEATSSGLSRATEGISGTLPSPARAERCDHLPRARRTARPLECSRVTGKRATLPRLAYGLHFTGIESRYLPPAHENGGPVVTVERALIDGDPGPTRIERGRATIRLVGGGRLEVERSPGRARFLTREPLDDDDLAHPYLAAAAGLLAGWAGWEPFHSGSFAVDGKAFAVLGDKEQGKSTLLAMLAIEGAEIVADDLLVLDGTDALPGPRCIDLRLAAVDWLEGSVPLERSRSGERWRLELPPIAGRRELAGWIALAWGDSLEVRSLAPAERLRLITRQHQRDESSRAEAALDFVAMPAWELRRPRRLELIRDTARRLLDLVA